MATVPLTPLDSLLKEVRSCTLCKEHLPCVPRPVLQAHQDAKILIAGQAPGNKVQQTGIPFDDASGDRLREWMGIDKEIFYDAKQMAILPMGFCFPGTGKSGDLPPRKECAPQWREQVLALLPKIELTLVIGQYAMAWHLQDNGKTNVTQQVLDWKKSWPHVLPLPHPSPRNNIWLKQNPWFSEQVLPALKEQVAQILKTSSSASFIRAKSEPEQRSSSHNIFKQ
ncbi:uracil-DNA glycosylase family protein [Undibacterium sp. Ji67W]|uniref:uracil-DNA glycosylase family protein n=1 Tax=Undibacterium sp. Ji67W TaxID=3413042 RepID=UPI003BF25615